MLTEYYPYAILPAITLGLSAARIRVPSKSLPLKIKSVTKSLHSRAEICEPKYTVLHEYTISQLSGTMANRLSLKTMLVFA